MSKKKVIHKPATSTKGFWHSYDKHENRSVSPAIKMLDKHQQIVMFNRSDIRVGVSVTGVSMRDGIMKGKFKGLKVQHQSGGVWVAA